jgi:uncharacterized protein YndB with AHSA1/START domain
MGRRVRYHAPGNAHAEPADGVAEAPTEEHPGVRAYRLVLTYADASRAAGKAADDSAIVEARYVDIVPDVRVVQAVDFVSDDPAFAGTTTMTWEVTAVDGGTRVDITADDVPDGISAEDHAIGLASSLANLAELVER